MDVTLLISVIYNTYCISRLLQNPNLELSSTAIIIGDRLGDCFKRVASRRRIDLESTAEQINTIFGKPGKGQWQANSLLHMVHSNGKILPPIPLN
jgi:hypothetical protein